VSQNIAEAIFGKADLTPTDVGHAGTADSYQPDSLELTVEHLDRVGSCVNNFHNGGRVFALGLSVRHVHQREQSDGSQYRRMKHHPPFAIAVRGRHWGKQKHEQG
jgi:hypothetical protein